MRTTVTLDPDVELIVRQRMESYGVPFRIALNDLIRRGTAAAERRQFHTPAHALGRPRIDLDRAGTLAGELDDDDTIAELRGGS